MGFPSQNPRATPQDHLIQKVHGSANGKERCIAECGFQPGSEYRLRHVGFRRLAGKGILCKGSCMYLSDKNCRSFGPLSQVAFQVPSAVARVPPMPLHERNTMEHLLNWLDYREKSMIGLAHSCCDSIGVETEGARVGVKTAEHSNPTRTMISNRSPSPGNLGRSCSSSNNERNFIGGHDPDWVCRNKGCPRRLSPVL